VTERWALGSSNLGLVLGNGIWVTYTDDARSPEDYAKDASESIEGGFWNGGRLLRVRGVTGAGTAGGPNRSAYLVWIEGEHLTEVFGFGGQSLGDLLEFAERMAVP
jgi:hypothetical protein